jgi:nitroreductase
MAIGPACSAVTGPRVATIPTMEEPEVDPSELSMPIGEAMFTQRSIRRMRPDPIPVAHLHVIIAAAAKAPNGSNRQIGRLLVATDRDKIAAFGELYQRSWWAKRKEDQGWSGPEDVSPGDTSMAPAMRLAGEMKDVPCVVFVLSEPPHGPESVLPAAQNLMLAARALGIGSVPTRLYPGDHDEFRALFGVPDHIEVHFAIPLGYPQGRFGPTTRLPTAETTYWNQWGDAAPWA